MPPAPFAILLLAATIDPRLAETLWLLAEIGARDDSDGHLRPYFSDVPESLGLTGGVGRAPTGIRDVDEFGIGRTYPPTRLRSLRPAW